MPLQRLEAGLEHALADELHECRLAALGAVELGVRFTAKAEGETLRVKELKTREEKTLPVGEAAAVLSR